MGLVSFELEAKWKKQKIQREQVAVGRHHLFGAFMVLTQAVSPFKASLTCFNVCSAVFLVSLVSHSSGKSALIKHQTPLTKSECLKGETKQAPGRKMRKRPQVQQSGGGGANSPDNLSTEMRRSWADAVPTHTHTHTLVNMYVN